MHLKLRRRARLRCALLAANDLQSCRNCFIARPLYQRDTPCDRAAKLAADVHPYAAENCSESSVVLKKILIVDDSPSQVRLMQGLLETEGYQPVGLNDPRRIEETITAEGPSVILLDVVMPERNGFQVCRELKSNAKFNTIPVILVTSKDTPSDRYWGEQQGADGYVTKPFTREELLRAVRRFA
jgi:twitching motility two-component system response regulator PilH